MRKLCLAAGFLVSAMLTNVAPALAGGPVPYADAGMYGGDAGDMCDQCDPCSNGGRHGAGRRRNQELGFNCGCNGSYKFPVPPLYTYHWPGMYSAQLMTDYHSPWRFPPLKPYVDEVPIESLGSARRVARSVQPASATIASPSQTNSHSFSSHLEQLQR